ncbi:TetR/AcrR family transcriptional regulator [Vibrio sp. FNV 38]|nr:TetR/AcrR family transcriptional regulator [Vibrio sp. FNV 38]
MIKFIVSSPNVFNQISRNYILESKQTNGGRRKAEDSAKTKNLILSSAFELFSTKGFDATSLREIANLADVAHGTITHHLGSKIDIWNAIAHINLDQYHQELDAALSQSLNHEMNALEVFQSAVEVLIDTLLAHPQLVRMISMEYDVENERAAYITQNLTQTHVTVSQLFDAAQDYDKRLNKYNADTFLIALLGLTSAPALFPVLQTTLTNTNIATNEFKLAYKNVIIRTLFHD